MKKVADILISIITGIAIFTLVSYTNSLGPFSVVNASYIIGFFISGLIISMYYNKRHVLISFCAIILILLISVFIVGDFLVLTILHAIALCFGFSLGYLWMRLKPGNRVGPGVILIGFYLLAVFYIVPHYEYRIISKTKGIFENKQATIFFKNVELKDTTGSMKKDLLEEGKVSLVEFYFKNCMPCWLKEKALSRLRKEISDTSFRIIYIQSGEIDDFNTSLLTCRETKSKANRFYDVNGALSSNLSIKGFPFELIIDKKGYIRQTSNGFSQDVAGIYINERKTFIKSLLHE